MDSVPIDGLAFVGPIMLLLGLCGLVGNARRRGGFNPPPTTMRPKAPPPPPPPRSAVPRPTHYTVYAPDHEPHNRREDPPMARLSFRTDNPGVRFRIENGQLIAENTTNKNATTFVTIYTPRGRVMQFVLAPNSLTAVAQLDDPALGAVHDVILEAKAVHVRHDYELISSEPFISFADGSAIEIHTLRCRLDQYETREFIAVGTRGYAHKHLTEIMKAIPDAVEKTKADIAKANVDITARGKP